MDLPEHFDQHEKQKQKGVAKTEGNSVENEPKGQAKKTNMYVSVYK
jgi:hypothetical protein